MKDKRLPKPNIKADLLLILALLLLGGGVFLWQYLSRREGGCVAVYVDNVCTCRYPLSEDMEVSLPSPDGSSYNILVIRNGVADVTEAGCPDKICVNSHPIRYNGQTITCLPNHTSFVIEGGENSGVDIG